MALFCASKFMKCLNYVKYTVLVSNEVPEHPVVSPSGNVFERNLIVKYIEDNGVDPINGEVLSVDQLIPLKSNMWDFSCSVYQYLNS